MLQGPKREQFWAFQNALRAELVLKAPVHTKMTNTAGPGTCLVPVGDGGFAGGLAGSCFRLCAELIFVAGFGCAGALVSLGCLGVCAGCQHSRPELNYRTITKLLSPKP